MKKILITICLVVAMLLVVPVTSKGKEASYVSIGGGQDAFIVEAGITTPDNDGNVLFAFNIGHGPGKHLDLGEECYANSFSVKAGFEVKKDSDLYLNGLLGVSLYDKKELDHYTNNDPNSSNYGKSYECEEIDSKFRPLCGVGVSYFVPNSPILVSVDYDNVRELTGSVGYYWKF